MLDFKYLDEHNLLYPQIILGYKCEYNIEEQPNFKDKNGWLNIAHQTGGFACQQHYFVAKILQPKSVETLNNIRKLCDKWYESLVCFNPSLTIANEYSKDLSDLLGVTTNNSYIGLEEGLYPIDCTPENISKLTNGNDLPENLDDLVNWTDPLERFFGGFGRWNLFILGENCD